MNDDNFEELYNEYLENTKEQKNNPGLNKLNDSIDKNLKLIGHNFEEYDLPKDKLYLRHYFTTNIEKVFLDYYTCFNEIKHFTDHTGIRCHMDWLGNLEKRYLYLIKLHKKAKDDFDFEFLADLEMGQIIFKKAGIKYNL